MVDWEWESLQRTASSAASAPVSPASHCRTVLYRYRTAPPHHPPPVPQALPILVAEDNRAGLEALAAAAGMELPRLMRDYGHCVVARELYQGSTRFDAFIAVLESITGQVGRVGGRVAGSHCTSCGVCMWEGQWGACFCSVLI